MIEESPPRRLAAGGTLPRAQGVEFPRAWRGARLILEIVLIFVCAPLALRYAVFEWGLPLFFLLPPVFAVFIAGLLWDRSFSVRRELSQGFSFGVFVTILAVFAVGAAVAAAYVSEETPRQFLSFPRNRPELWALIIAVYPFLSVIPQELAYRTFFFHRYGPLFGSARWLAILTNGLLFGVAHVVVNNWFAVLGTAFAGLLFAYTYDRTRSFWAVVLEHTLWGWLVFTVGLGAYFFTGVAFRAW